MTAPIKGCPQPDAPELVMRADGYHYRTEDEVKELTDEDLDRLMKENVPTAVRCPPGWRNAFRAAIAADRALNAEDHDPLEPKRLESIADPTLRAVCETYTNTPGGHFMRLQAIAKLVHAPADRDVMRQAPNGWKLVPIEPTLDQYNSACRAYSDWQVQCQEEAREHEDERNPSWGYSQPHFTHSDVYRAMLAAAPTPPAEQQEEQEPAAYMRHRLMSNAGGFGGGVVCEFSEQPFNDDGGSDGIEALYVHQSPSLAELRAKVEALPVVDTTEVPDWHAVYLHAVLAEIDKMGGGT